VTEGTVTEIQHPDLALSQSQQVPEMQVGVNDPEFVGVDLQPRRRLFDRWQAADHVCRTQVRRSLLAPPAAQPVCVQLRPMPEGGRELDGVQRRRDPRDLGGYGGRHLPAGLLPLQPGGEHGGSSLRQRADTV
jgi:hypothetical protein